MYKKVLLQTAAVIISVVLLAVSVSSCKSGTDNPKGGDSETAQSGDALSGEQGDVDGTGDPNEEITSDMVDENGSRIPNVSGNNGSKVNNGSNVGSNGASSTPGGGGGNTVISASFTRNADGTCTDKATGVVFLDDDLVDWNRTFQRGNDLQMDVSNAAFFEGDSSRVVRGGKNKDTYITYKLDKGITEIGIIAYFDDVGAKKTAANLEVFVSADGSKWTAVSDLKHTDSNLGSGWVKRTTIKKGIAAGNKYIKIQFPANITDVNYFIPNLGRLRVNNVDKMNDADRYLEDRASATFYVDPSAGSDNNDGMSAGKAFKSLYKVSNKFFQPGDKLLFKSGATFNGSVVINGFGYDNNLIYIGSYGSGNKPKISARGGSALQVKASNITIENLEITNPNGLIGIEVLAQKTGANKNITISGCNIHDVNTAQNNFDSYENGGIIVAADGIEATWFENMIIQNNTIQNVSKVGILMTSQWAYRPGRWGKNNYKSDTDGWYPAEKPIIRGNNINKTYGDGLFICGARNALIEKNTVQYAFQTKKTGYPCVALWSTNTTNTVIQYNEVAYTSLAPGNSDGEAFDVDITEVNTTIQYNYSHDNAGGFLLIFNQDDGVKVSKNATVRYNLSVNDGSVSKKIFQIGSKNPGTKIYNNTIFSNLTSIIPVHTFADPPEDFTFTNNIFHGEKGGTFSWDIKSGVKNFLFENNIFSGGVPIPTSNVTQRNNKSETVSFKNKAATTFDNKAQMIAALTPSKAISGASAISNNGGKDINGTAISSNFYGAIKY